MIRQTPVGIPLCVLGIMAAGLFLTGCQTDRETEQSARIPSVLVREAPPLRFRGANSASPDQPGDTDCNSPGHWDRGSLYVFSSAGHPWRSSGADLFHLTGDYRSCQYDNKVNGGRWIECT